MSLLSYCNDALTDKNTIHSYVEVYEELFREKKFTATHVLEIGIGPFQPNGGSILMWANYFPNAEIHTADIIPLTSVNPELLSHPRIYLHAPNDAYQKEFFVSAFQSKPVRYDILIDDGPHTIESMVSFIVQYSQVMKEDGILVIEDVQKIEWIDILRACTPDALKPYIEVYDRRLVKGRYDDIMFVIRKRSSA
jgi:hypothetical protein